MNLVFQQAERFGSKTAIIDDQGPYSYIELDDRSDWIANYLLLKGIQKGDRITFLIPPEFNFVAVLFAIWKVGAIAVPLCTIHPVPELQYVVDDSQSELLICGDEFFDKASELSDVKCIPTSEIYSSPLVAHCGSPLSNDPSLILYTSGTTSRPKGVLHTHKSLNSTINSMIESWEWHKDDHILHVLPLHHTHGLINKLLCSLTVGATCEFLSKFDKEIVWNKFQKGDVNLFMAVPTIYSKLIKYWDEQITDRQLQLSEGVKKMRLMVSGSAALPVPVLDKWETISGHRLLERYGMTEIGMAISNPYDGERRPGHIGLPMPGVKVRLVDDKSEVVETKNGQGEIQIKGATLFKEYWNKEEATKESFTGDGWFKTGDIAVVVDDYFKMLGRNSVDIIKSGGYKISALEIESKLLDHPEIEECAVVGISDKEWGEVVGVAIVSKAVTLSLSKCQLPEIQEWAKDKLAPYKIPRQLINVDELPRNVLGKVTKNEIKKLF